MPIVPREKFDHFVRRRYQKVWTRIWGQIEGYLVENPEVARLVEGFVNNVLNHASNQAAERAVLSGSRVVRITSSVTKLAAQMHGHLPPEVRRGIQGNHARMILAYSLVENGYDVDGDTFTYTYEVPEPEEEAEYAEVVRPLEIGTTEGRGDDLGGPGGQPPDEPPKQQPRREEWRRAPEPDPEPDEPQTRPTRQEVEPEPELVVGQTYKNRRGLERRVDSVSDDGKVGYTVLVGSRTMPAGTEGSSTIWSFVKWARG